MLRPAGLALVDPSRPAAFDYVSSLLFPIVGTLVAWRRPDNAVGWMLLALSAIGAVQTFAGEYALRDLLVESGSLPGAAAAAWMGTWLWIVWFSFIPLILLHFPDGALPSPGWRWLRRACVLPAALVLAPAVETMSVPARVLLLNDDDALPAWMTPLLLSAIAALLVLVLASVVSLFVRYRRARNEQRQQIKWVLVAAAVLVAEGIWDLYLPGPEALKLVLAGIAFAAIPASMGIAILKYRLFDIDVIINRALVYGVLTAILGAAYVAGVVVLQGLLGPVTQGNELAIAGSTLAVAALFRPARARVQGLLDRRFFRDKYDAVRTLDAFSSRLRDEVDLDSLTAELLSVVHETMRPGHASLWLRPPEPGRSGGAAQAEP